MAKRTQSKTSAKRPTAPKRQNRRRNPDGTQAAADLYTDFHGRPPRRMTEHEIRTEEPDALAELGVLVALHVDVMGDTDASTTLTGFEGTKLCATPDTGQLYLVGGDQSLPLDKLGLANLLPRDHIAIGDCWRIEYETRKGFDKFKQVIYVHDFGEEGGFMPILCYDTRNARLYFVGGSYTIDPDGIRD